MAAVLPPHSTIMSNQGLNSSLISRRTATGNLPGPLELPVNTLTAKFGGPLSSSSLPAVANGQQSSINALLTPPSHISGDSLSPISSGSGSASNPAANGLPPYTPTGYWSHAGANPYAVGTASMQQPSSGAQSWNAQATAFNTQARGRFSPSLTSLMRGGHPAGSPAEQLPPPSTYDLGALPPFPNALGPISPGSGGSAPPAGLAYSLPGQAHAPLATHGSAPGADGGYLHKLPPTPGYYPGSQPSMTPQQAHFPQYPSPGGAPSPVSMHGPTSRLSPLGQPMQPYARPPYGLPAPMMPAGMHPHPGMAQPGMLPIFNSGHAAHMGHLYGAPPGAAPAERPFKCDQCPQSFNRNHDLKRHKRIHLAVKPFPCGHCDKSFSRKDALKRHILVKGCGKSGADAAKAGADADDKDADSDGSDSPMQSS